MRGMGSSVGGQGFGSRPQVKCHSRGYTSHRRLVAQPDRAPGGAAGAGTHAAIIVERSAWRYLREVAPVAVVAQVDETLPEGGIHCTIGDLRGADRQPEGVKEALRD